MQRSYAKADVGKNRLFIKVAKKITKQDLDNLYTDIRFCVADLSPGFSVLTDLSECTIAMLSGVQTFRKISNFLIENEVGAVVRVVNDKSVLFRQFVNLTSRTQGYKPIYVFSLEEAENHLAKAERRSSPRFRLYKQKVEYKGAGFEGNGFIVDISTDGCAIEPESPLPDAGEEVSITIPFDSHNDLVSRFETGARIVKTNQDSFAVQYHSLDDEIKERLLKRLVHESKCDVQS